MFTVKNRNIKILTKLFVSVYIFDITFINTVNMMCNIFKGNMLQIYHW